MFGFSASMNFFGKKKHKGLHSELSPDMTVSGAYRISRDDSFGYNNSFAAEQMQPQIRPTKSTNDLTKVKQVPLPQNLRNSTTVSRGSLGTEVSGDPHGPTQETQDPRTNAQNIKLTKQQEKEQKRLEKQLQAEQKAREKQARKEQAKMAKRPDKRSARKEETLDRSLRKLVPPKPRASAPVAHSSQQYPTNTLESSISRSSGPPPYSAVPRLEETPSETTRNVTYKKKEDKGSWDMISKHREQIKPTSVIGGNAKNKPMVMDLNYRFGNEQGTSNSEA